jgi:hypothetical protein
VYLTTEIDERFPALDVFWDELETFRKIAAWCITYDENLNEWDLEFCWSIAMRGSTRLSPKQWACLNRIYAKTLKRPLARSEQARDCGKDV